MQAKSTAAVSAYALKGNPWAAVMPRNQANQEASVEDQVSLTGAAVEAPAQGRAAAVSPEALERSNMIAAVAATPCDGVIRLILLGDAQSQKAQHAAKLAEEFEVPHVHMGDLITREIASGSKRGRQLQAAQEAGRTPSAEVLQDLIQKRLEQDDVQKGFILDAYPADLAAKGAERLASNLEDLHIIELNQANGQSSCPTCIPAVEAVRNKGEYYTVDNTGDQEEVGNVLGALAMNFQAAPNVTFK